MSTFTPNRTFLVSTAGNVNPASFVTLSGSFTVAQSTTGDSPLGITDLGSRNYNTTYLGAPGDQVGVFGAAQECALQVSATTAAGAFLKPDVNGFGTPTTTASDLIGAVALESGVNGSQIRVRVLQPHSKY